MNGGTRRRITTDQSNRLKKRKVTATKRDKTSASRTTATIAKHAGLARVFASSRLLEVLHLRLDLDCIYHLPTLLTVVSKSREY